MTTRRNFLIQTGIVATAMMVIPDLLLAKPAYKSGLQLYSLRDEIKNGIKEVITKAAKAGYQEIETFGFSKDNGFFGLKAKEFKQLLKANGLTSPSGHYGIDTYLGGGSDADFKIYLEAAAAMGQTYFTVPYLGDQLRKTPEDFKKLALRMNKAAEICKKSGLKLAYHNHDFEFKQVDGTMLYDVLLKETDPKLVDFEMDIYWVVRAGQDPVKMIKAHPGRFTMWHIKDMDKSKPELNTEIGSGSIDFKKIFALAQTSGLKHIFMEQENFTNIDPYKSIAQSSSYIKNTLFK